MENLDPTFTEQIFYVVLFYAVIAIAGLVLLLRDMRKDYQDEVVKHEEADPCEDGCSDERKYIK